MAKYFIQAISLMLVSGWVSAKIIVLNGLTHIHSGNQGQAMNGKIQVKNVGTSPEKVLVYKKGLVQNCDGKVDFVEVGADARTLGKWLETNVDEKVLEAGESYEILYTIRIPQDSTLGGSYWGVLMVEGAPPLFKEKEGSLAIESRIRYAIQVVLDIGIAESPQLHFENVALKKANPKQKIVQAKIKNLGKFMVIPKLMLEIYGKDGQKLLALEAPSQKVYPFTCKDFDIEIKDLPSGKYEAVLIADYGQNLFGTNLVIEID
ncbi:hypothetical protein [Runella zeae]|uniref:hypothetical protein n=1 Tax=Runella zeae TaxID=94255 RepID=UPI0004135C4B|nr:hypothetical protein [Runella zeae]